MIKPKQKPNANNFKAIVDKKIASKNAVFLVGIRGYYKDTMGVPGKNDRGIYDDAIGIVIDGSVQTFNANVDPYGFRKGIANLTEGRWLYKLGIHGLNKPKSKQYQALVQASDVVVSRDGVGLDKGRFGINIHRGMDVKVSSIGCQTIPPEQWLPFLNAVKSAMKLHDMDVIEYFLVAND